MKRSLKFFIFQFLIFTALTSHTKELENPKKIELKLGVKYEHAFTIDGHIRVREFDLQGDLLEWEQLGMHNFSVPGAFVSIEFREKHLVRFNYDRIYFFSKKVIDRNIEYNGTIIDGRSGIDLSPSIYQRITLEYERRVLKPQKFGLIIMGGFVYDYFTIYLDGDISPESERAEVYEQFERQALPYPFLGIKGEYDLNDRSGIQSAIKGTYIPQFNSFFHEGGDVALQYNSLILNLEYFHDWKNFEFNVGVCYRSIYLLGESDEDTNEFSLSSIGPSVNITYKIY